MMKRFAARFFLFLGMTLWTAVLAAGGAASESGKHTAAVAAESEWVPASPSPSARDLGQLYARLRADYGYRPAIDPLSSFSQGAPGLTPESAALALGEARRHADRLTAAVASFERLSEDKSVDPAAFEDRRSRDLAEIADLADRIQGDAYVRILDRIEKGGAHGDLPEPLRPDPTATGLRRLADELQRGVASHLRPQGVQVVDVADLRRPSLESISRAIRDLAETMRASKLRAATGDNAESATR